jgi:hypothetical protein
MGTHYVREISQMFKDIAEKTQFPDLKEKLTSLANEMEPLATKLYFKTQKGTEDTERIAAEVAEVQGKLAECEQAADAEAVCNPYFEELEKIIKHVKTMKVRMT